MTLLQMLGITMLSGRDFCEPSIFQENEPRFRLNHNPGDLTSVMVSYLCVWLEVRYAVHNLRKRIPIPIEHGSSRTGDESIFENLNTTEVIQSYNVKRDENVG